MSFLYRGVHARHPAWNDARLGVVRPGDVNGKISAKEHNDGGYSALSPFTSWTPDRDRAKWHAGKKGPGGLILSVNEGAPEPGEDWVWVWSEDRYFENEVLLRGIRMKGVEVTEA